VTEGFDFTTDDVLEWELEAIWAAIDQERLVFSRHARQELSLDALTLADVLDALSFPDDVSKDLPGGSRAPGLNFDRHLGRVRVRAKVGWRDAYYVVITVMAN
jgi:hypothetical protein